jgi:hypothetical protein
MSRAMPAIWMTELALLILAAGPRRVVASRIQLSDNVGGLFALGHLCGQPTTPHSPVRNRPPVTSISERTIGPAADSEEVGRPAPPSTRIGAATAQDP